MKSIIATNILLSILLLVSLTGYIYAGPALPVSSQGTQKEEKIQIIPEIKIEAQSSASSSKSNLKQGDACGDEDLEEAEGEVFTDIPMAETIPCDEVDCKNLQSAKLLKDDYVALKTAKTVSCDK